MKMASYAYDTILQEQMRIKWLERGRSKRNGLVLKRKSRGSVKEISFFLITYSSSCAFVILRSPIKIAPSVHLSVRKKQLEKG